jgi:metal-dependent amidase/aminoacylase/carboxypeptidase family protein
MPAVVNSPGLVSLALDVLPETKHTIVELTEPPLTTDDFSLLAERGPTLYFKLGVTPLGADAILPLHTGLFDVDEGCIPVAVDGLERLVKSAVASAGRGENLS